ncbi:MAG: hypothetical protein CM15mP28_2190 [Pseudomonadota bacterium]|nr:MAG: hypothetical protein CM15mP28_2190 [Pseudomonadota bacterium]
MINLDPLLILKDLAKNFDFFKKTFNKGKFFHFQKEKFKGFIFLKN